MADIKVPDYIDDAAIYSYGIPDHKIKPCPHCHARAEILGVTVPKNHERVSCVNCKAVGPSFDLGSRGEGRILAIKQWNARIGIIDHETGRPVGEVQIATESVSLWREK